MSVRDWSIGRLLLVSVLWALAVLLLTAWRALSFMWGQGDQGGLVGVSAGLDDLLKLAGWIIIPPVILFTVWLVQRR